MDIVFYFFSWNLLNTNMDSTVIAFIVVIIIIAVVCGIGVGTSLEKFNQDLEYRVTVPGQAGLKWAGTFVVVQIEQATPLTLIDGVAEVEDWECSDGEKGVCTGKITFEVPEK